MRWFKRDQWKIGITIAGMLLFLALMVWLPLSAVSAHEGTSGLATPRTVTVQATPTVDPTIVAETAQEQLTKLRRDNDRSFPAWFWGSGAALLSTIVALGVGFAGFWKVWSDQFSERQRREQERITEREKRVEERFQSAVTGLGDEKVGARIAAAIVLRTFMREGEVYEQFYIPTFDLAVANLRLRPVDPNTPDSLGPLDQALITVFKESFSAARKMLKKRDGQLDFQLLDASRIQLDNAFLAPRIDLKGIWMREASLRKAHLNNVDLREANLRRTDLSGAYLSGADLSGADLSITDLSGAHLNEANLSGANIEKARLLKDTDLRGAKGLTPEQKATCKTKGAIVDAISTTNAPQLAVAPSSPSQSNDAQASSTPSAQGSTPPPDPDGSSAVPSPQEPNS